MRFEDVEGECRGSSSFATTQPMDAQSMIALTVRRRGGRGISPTRVAESSRIVKMDVEEEYRLWIPH